MRLAIALICSAIVAAVAAPVASAQQAAAPNPRPVTQDGPSGRYMLDGQWLLRVDRSDRGAGQHWERRRATGGWTPVTVPNAWNANDRTSSGFIGAPAWYRRDFRLPSRAKGLDWLGRFDWGNCRAPVWLNGTRLGGHAGGFLPFELPLKALNRGGRNRLVVRVDNRRLPTDFPPTTFTRTNEPRGGWWNYGGIVREVYLRRIDRVAFDRVIVRPSVPCPTCRVFVRLTTVVRNVSGRPRRVRVRANFGGLRVDLGRVTVRPGSRRTLTRRIPVFSPHLWTPATPFLYPVSFSATTGSGVAARYVVHTGLRSVRVRADGRLLLNGLPVNLRGVAVHDDIPGRGAALSEADRAALVRQIKETGSTLVRSPYPPGRAFAVSAEPGVPVARRPRRPVDLVGGARVPDEHRLPVRVAPARRGRPRAHERSRQREPSVGGDLVDRQRAQGHGPRAREAVHPVRGAGGERARPVPARRHGDRGPPVRSVRSRLRAAERPRAQRLLRLVRRTGRQCRRPVAIPRPDARLPSDQGVARHRVRR